MPNALCCEADRVRHERVKRWTPRAQAFLWSVRTMHWKVLADGTEAVFWHWADTVIEERAIPS